MAFPASPRVIAIRELPIPRSVRPRNWRIGLALNLGLCVLIVVSFITGWIASLLGLTEFGIHKYSSIAVFALATLHLVFHAHGLKAQIRRLRQ